MDQRHLLHRRLGLFGSNNRPKVVVLLPHRFYATINLVISFIMQPWKMREMGYTTTTMMAMETA
jgi:hypothetical protein